MSYPGYPSSSAPGYPPYPQSSSPSNFGFNAPQNPPGTGMPGYAPYPGAGYPQPSSGSPYPPSTSPYPPPTSVPGGYPPATSGYPSAPPPSGYPAASAPGYPPSNPSPYPPSAVPGAYSSVPGGGVYPQVSSSAPYGGGGSVYPAAPAYPPSGSPYASAPYGQAPASYPGTTPAYQPPGSYGAPSYPPTTQQNYGTIHPHQGFDSRFDAEALRKAMKGFGTDEKAIINILAHRSYAQRLQIVVTYKTQFGKDLINQLKDELSGNFEDVIVAMLIPRTHLLAKHLYHATSWFGTAEMTLVEILCTSSNAEIREINTVYRQLYHSTLESDLKGDTFGFFKRLLVSLNMGNRDESTHVDQARAVQDAQSLYQAGEGRWGTDESTFNRILVSQSFTQLQAVFYEYQRLTGRPIEHAVRNEMTGDVLNGMLAIIACVRNKITYFAERLHHCMSGAGTSDKTLIRIIVTRSEIDLALIKQEFQKKFGRSLHQRIHEETSGDYKKVLLEILRD